MTYAFAYPTPLTEALLDCGGSVTLLKVRHIGEDGYKVELPDTDLTSCQLLGPAAESLEDAGPPVVPEEIPVPEPGGLLFAGIILLSLLNRRRHA